MRRRLTLALVALLASAGLVGPAVAGPGPGASWQMNEASGPMTDSVGDNDSSNIGPGITRSDFGGGGHGFYFRAKGVITVPDSPSLRPGARDVTIEVRLKPAELGDRNIVQKGQYSAAGHQYKLEIVGNSYNCVFKGSGGDRRVGNATGVKGTARSKVWQTVQCIKHANSIALVVNGTVRATRNVAAGSIGTYGKNVQIGGKVGCRRECDYYLGAIDYAKISIG